MIMDDGIEVKRCGVKFSPPALVLNYLIKDSGKMHRRTMPLRNFNKNSSVDATVDELLANPKHSKFMKCMPKFQLYRLIAIIRDKLGGMSLEESLARNDEIDRLDPEEDLNKVDVETLQRKKSIMEDTFEKNLKKPSDPDFQYDVQMDFNEVEACEWDSEESDQEF
ncbi:centrosomal protein of 19 kDa-like [Ostrea edulis]|uniref:centrosomal protein of 19 kDa-like n=1 Tax=Ostrea edulis TaxID=37623 RepID=UPI002094F461|nr:centrosomal protein of 19 kDa-like [Ostrea edulis]